MLFQLKKDIRVPLTPEGCLRFLEKNGDSICDFPPLFLSGTYYFTRPFFRLPIIKEPDFSLQPGAGKGGFAINGQIKEDDDHSIVSVGAFPPPWLFILIWLITSIMFIKIFVPMGAAIVPLIWFFLFGMAIRSWIKTAIKLIDNLEATLKSASAGSPEIENNRLSD